MKRSIATTRLQIALQPPELQMPSRSVRTALQFAAAPLSAIALFCAFPAPDQGWLAWIALVPLLIACLNAPPGRAFAIGFVSGTLAAYGIYRWLLEVPAFGAPQAIVLAIYVALYPALWCTALPVLSRSRIPLVITAPALWVVLEYARSHAGFLALPWATLAHTQHENLAVLQLASITGEAGVSFLVVMVNTVAALALLSRLRVLGVAVAAAVVACVHALGVAAISASPSSPVVRVAAIQPNIGLAERESHQGRVAIWARLEALTMATAASRPAVIVWPETAVGDPRHDDVLARRLQLLAQSAQAPLIVGAAQTEKFSPADQDPQAKPRREHYNAAYVVASGEPLGEPYRKRQLVPFGEYVPREGVIPWPRWLVPDIVAASAGPAEGKLLDAGGLRIGALICWENLFSALARSSAAQGAQVLVQLTNDVWFGRSPAARQHNLASVLRAVENGTAVIISSNSGPSQIIDRFGRIAASVPELFATGHTIADVRMRRESTFYTRTGDWAVLLASISVALSLALKRSISHPQRKAI